MEIQNSHIPHFPLELVPFPGERLNLHIFEPRYRQLIHQIHQTGGSFCIPAVIDKKVQSLATEMRLIKIAQQYDDGRMDVSVEGIGIVRTIDFFPMLIGWLYPGGSIERIPSIENGHDLNRLKIIDLVRELWTLLKIDKVVPVLSELTSVYTIGHHIGLDLALEYQMLSLQEELDRQEMVIQHLEDLMPSVRELEEIRRKAGMNGHFRELPPSDWA
ncbi:MAG: hypothetical protein K9I85_03740 [Saprospiraceae bacterium]|nr:hypothetical protein [Saprospiraceae bacterium]